MASPRNLFAPGGLAAAAAAKPRSYQAIVADVRGGRITQTEGVSQLRAIGLPDTKNPFVNSAHGSLGQALHDVAAPLGLSRSTNIKQEAAYQAQHGHPEINGGIVTPGVGVVSQLLGSLGQQAVYNPGGVAALGEHPVRTAKAIGRNVEQTVKAPQKHLADAFLLGSALISGGGSALARAAGATDAVRAGEGVRAAVARPGHAGGSLLHSPEPGTSTLYAPGHMAPGVQGPREAVAVDRILSRNPVVRNLIQKPRNARLQAKLNETPRSPGTQAGRAVQGTFSAQTTVGRERRAAMRVDNAKQGALRNQQIAATRGLSRGEHAALGVVGVEGKTAFENPQDVLARHIGVHEHFANLGGDVENNQRRIADLKTALPALANPSAKFKRAVALTQQLSNRTERQLIDAGHLDAATAQGRRDAIAGIYGGKAGEGSFFFPLSRQYVEHAPTGAPGAFQARPGEYGVGPVQPGQHVQALHQHFTGESVAQGLTPVNVAAGIAHRSAKVDRLLAAENNYTDLWRASSATRRSSFDIPVRSTKQVHTELRQFFTKLADHLHASPDEQVQLSADELKSLTSMVEANEHAAAGVGAKVPGVRWVDKRYLADLGETTPRGIIEKAADTITNPIRTADLYARPAYILNLAGNLGMAGITQGAKVIPSLRRAVIATRADGRANTAIVDSLVGASLSKSYAVNTGFGHEINEQLASAWNALTDLYVRRSAFYHEAGMAGYSTPADIERLLHSPQLHSKLVEVTRRANKNMVDYGSLTPVERNTIRRLIYFYPWVSRATIWSLRTLVENPGKTFALAQLGDIGAENARKRIGPMPPWAAQLGLIPVGERHGDLQHVLNPSSLDTYGTASQAISTIIDTVKAASGLAHGQGSLGGALTPAATLTAQAASGGGATTQATGLKGLLESLPQYQALVRAGVVGHPSKTYPDTGLAAAAGPYAAGGLYPRDVNTEQLRKQARAATGSQHQRLSLDLARAVQLGLLTQDDEMGFLTEARKASDAEIVKFRSELDRQISQAAKAGATRAH